MKNKQQINIEKIKHTKQTASIETKIKTNETNKKNKTNTKCDVYMYKYMYIYILNICIHKKI